MWTIGTNPATSLSPSFHALLRFRPLGHGKREAGSCTQTSARTWAGARIEIPVALGARFVGLGGASGGGFPGALLLGKVVAARLKRVASTAVEFLRMKLLDVWKAMASELVVRVSEDQQNLQSFGCTCRAFYPGHPSFDRDPRAIDPVHGSTAPDVVYR